MFELPAWGWLSRQVPLQMLQNRLLVHGAIWARRAACNDGETVLARRGCVDTLLAARTHVATHTHTDVSIYIYIYIMYVCTCC